MKKILALCALVCLLLSGACAHQNDSMSDGQPMAGAAINTVCPVSGEKVQPGLTVEYEGAKIGFCCNNCVNEFKGWDDAKKSSTLAKLKSQR